MDKTALIRQLAEGGKHYFLSRLRRFGKSLLLYTIKELFEGNEALFEGLAIHDQWDWSIHRPVLRISFGFGQFSKPGELQARFREMLEPVGRSVGVGLEGATAAGSLTALIKALRESGGRRVAVLVDEYDKPILDALDAPEMARVNRDFLRGVYSVIKDCDECIKFTLLKGVSKFSKVSLFFGLNNLMDITLDPAYSVICGYKEQDLDKVFAPELEGLGRDKVRRWYNGYNWRGKEKVYNPFDILLLFRQREFKAHWFETGSPRFLIDTLLRRGVPTLDLEGMVGSEALLAANDFEGLEALLRAVFAAIPHQWHTRNDIQDYEGYYASVICSYFAAQSLDLIAEDSASGGRADMTVRCGGNVYLFEFKLLEDGSQGKALAQIKDKGYADKYRHLDSPIHLIGAEFSKMKRNIVAFEVERAV